MIAWWWIPIIVCVSAACGFMLGAIFDGCKREYDPPNIGG